MERKFTPLDLAPIVMEIAKAAEKSDKKSWQEDEVTEKIFLGDDGAELEILRWSQGPEYFFN